MPEVIIKYHSDKTLQILRDLSKYFDFILSMPKSTKGKETNINGVPIIPADPSIDISGLSEIFTGKNIDAKALRLKAWQRK
jgi:hypothetical protein